MTGCRQVFLLSTMNGSQSVWPQPRGFHELAAIRFVSPAHDLSVLPSPRLTAEGRSTLLRRIVIHFGLRLYPAARRAALL